VTATDLRILTIENLRGSVSTFDLAFRNDAKLTVIYGENGSGKSTICDAIEFLGDGRIGSLEDRGLGNRTSRYWPSIGKVASDIKVSLVAGSQTCVATIRDGAVVVQPGEWRPRVAILRRPQILRLLDAQPATEPVNPSETPASEDQACGTSFSGGLIQTSVGTGLGSGGPLTKRSGWVA
jgi:energy-coupling factor transporter ATP-binding protein EcfA2